MARLASIELVEELGGEGGVLIVVNDGSGGGVDGWVGVP